MQLEMKGGVRLQKERAPILQATQRKIIIEALLFEQRALFLDVGKLAVLKSFTTFG